MKTGRISGSFSESSGNIVTLYIFDSSQYAAFRQGVSTGDMFVDSGAEGSFSASITSPGSYYLVLVHGAASSGLIQNVNVSYLVDGMNPVFLGTGLALILSAIVIGCVGIHRKRRGTAPRSITDVTMFDQPRS